MAFAQRVHLGGARFGAHASRGRLCPPSFVQASAAAASEHSEPHHDNLYLNSQPPQRKIGSVKVSQIEGKGRGVVATRIIAAGEVVLITPALACVTSQHQQRPAAESVVDKILDDKLFTSRWFDVLFDGTTKSTRLVPDLEPSSRGSELPEPLLAATSSAGSSAGSKQKTAGFAAGKKAFKTSSVKGGSLKERLARKAAAASPALQSASNQEDASTSTSATPAAPAGGLDKKSIRRVAMLVKYNCYGDDAEDLAACASRGEPPRGHIGLWPEFALLNHSCVPNAVNYVIGGMMVVRAVAPIQPGEEVLICYLGRPQLLPLSRRLALLKDDYGFECSCARCTAELTHMDKVEEQYEETWSLVNDRLSEQFVEARRSNDRAEVEEIYSQVSASLRDLYATFRKAFLSPRVRAYMLASLYDALELAMECEAWLGLPPDSTAALSTLGNCTKAIEAVSPGSDLNVLLALRNWDAVAALHGPGSPLEKLAAGAARKAHVLRYGPVSEGLMATLMDYNRQLHLQNVPQRPADGSHLQ